MRKGQETLIYVSTIMIIRVAYVNCWNWSTSCSSLFQYLYLFQYEHNKFNPI